MLARYPPSPHTCPPCVRTLLGSHGRRNLTRSAVSPLAESGTSRERQSSTPGGDGRQTDGDGEKEVGAMSRLLAEMSERNLEEGGRSAQRAVEEAGFDEELKQKLLNKIADAQFKVDNQQAFARAALPSSADRQSRDIASADAWRGDESLEDATRRMLNDSKGRPLRLPPRSPAGPARLPRSVDTGRPRDVPSSGARLANARDRSSVYSHMRDASLSKEERDKMRREMKERFTPGARPMPVTLTGLQSLANERIEDAIARGLFKNLPRGQVIERDYNMSSPFLDTTEYFLNKMIKKQDIVPPWIEKQQELVATATKFRGRIRNDWKRYAARMIASRGGSIESQVRRAQEYARAEEIVNPSRKKKEQINTVDPQGHVSQISLSGELQAPREGEQGQQPTVHITVEESSPPPQAEPETSARAAPTVGGEPHAETIDAAPVEDAPVVVEGAVFPFRDKAWEDAERSYQKLAIDNLNSLTRTYNLMAPNLARKPYFSLDRELRACFADVAPQLPGEILERSRKPKVKIEVITHRPGSVLEHLAGGSARVYDDRRQPYGFKELWRDVFGSRKQTV